MTRSPFRYRAELRDARRRLASIRTSVVRTPIGLIQYAERGGGFPLLLIHGIFGGHDAGMRVGDPRILAGYRAIAPSRFGYLGTPMPRDATTALQADAHAALLDALDVERAIVYAASAGVTSAVQVAIRHPRRVAGLVLQSSNVPGPPPRLPPRRLARAFWGSDALMWTVRTYLPGFIAHRMMGVPKTLPLSLADRSRLDGELDAIFPLPERIDGVMFDGYVGNKEINECRFEAVASPTLVVHFKDDGGPPYAAAVAMAGRIPGARTLSAEHGGHLGLGAHPDITAGISEFLREVVRSETVHG